MKNELFLPWSCIMRTVVTSLLVLGLFTALAGADDKDKKKPKFTIGKETTYVSGPVEKDGTIDYATALNERLSKSIKPKDNANVLLWKAFGPRPEGTRMPPEFFKWMGVPEPPERGDYLIDLGRYMKEHLKIEPGSAEANEIYEQQGRATQRPWTAQDYPALASWLRANEKALAVAVEATKRPHYFSPLTPRKTEKGSPGLISALLPGVQKCREIATALTARAMLNAAQGRPDEAWQDLLACHRLGRHVARGSTLIEGLVGLAVDTIASKADVAFLDGTKLTEKQLRGCLRDLQNLPSLPPAADRVDLGERFMFLDCVMMVHRHGLGYLELLAGGPAKKADPQLAHLLEDVDWDPVLRKANRWYDRLAAAMRVRHRGERERQLDQIEEELKGLKKALTAEGGLVKLLMAKDAAKARGEVLSDVLITLLIPAVRKVQQADDRVGQVQANVRVAFALACYRRANGRYPEKLDQLAPKYLAKVPGDVFNGQALVYRPAEGGYLLYSVGVNGKDEQGRSYQDVPPGDDLAVRMPVPKVPRK